MERSGIRKLVACIVLCISLIGVSSILAAQLHKDLIAARENVLLEDVDALNKTLGRHSREVIDRQNLNRLVIAQSLRSRWVDISPFFIVSGIWPSYSGNILATLVSEVADVRDLDPRPAYLEIWSLDPPRVLYEYPCDRRFRFDYASSYDDKFALFSCGTELHLVDFESGGIAKSWAGNEDISGSLSPDGLWVAVTLASGPTEIWNTDSQATSVRLSRIARNSIVFSEDSTSFAALSNGNQLEIWSLQASNIPVRQTAISLPQEANILDITFARNPYCLIYTSAKLSYDPIELTHSIHVYDQLTGHIRSFVWNPLDASPARFPSNVFVVNLNGDSFFYDIIAEIIYSSVPDDLVFFATNPRETLVIGSNESIEFPSRRASIRDITDVEIELSAGIDSWNALSSDMQGVEFSGDGTRLYTENQDGTIRVWEIGVDD